MLDELYSIHAYKDTCCTISLPVVYGKDYSHKYFIQIQPHTNTRAHTHTLYIKLYICKNHAVEVASNPPLNLNMHKRTLGRTQEPLYCTSCALRSCDARYFRSPSGKHDRAKTARKTDLGQPPVREKENAPTPKSRRKRRQRPRGKEGTRDREKAGERETGGEKGRKNGRVRA